MTKGGRELRVADFIREALADIIRSEMRDPRVGMVSVTDARVSKDLSYADVYVTSLATDAEDAPRADDPTLQVRKDDFIAVLNKASGFLRSAVAKRHTMRTTPKLRFHYDELIESGPRMEALITNALESDRDQHGDPVDGS